MLALCLQSCHHSSNTSYVLDTVEEDTNFYPLASVHQQEAEEEQNGINALPPELWAHILSFITYQEGLLYLREVCKMWSDLIAGGAGDYDESARGDEPPKKLARIGKFNCQQPYWSAYYSNNWKNPHIVDFVKLRSKRIDRMPTFFYERFMNHVKNLPQVYFPELASTKVFILDLSIEAPTTFSEDFIRDISEFPEDLPYTQEEKLDLRRAKEGTINLTKALQSPGNQVEELNLGGNAIGDEGVKDIAAALNSSHTRIKSINLAWNEISDEGAIALAVALKSSNSKIQDIVLSNNQIGERGAMALAEALRSAGSKVQRIDLANNIIGEKGAIALAEVLKLPHVQVEKLDLANNRIGDEGAAALAEALKLPYVQLKQLDLTLNRISDKGATALAGVLQSRDDEGKGIRIRLVNNYDISKKKLQLLGKLYPQILCDF